MKLILLSQNALPELFETDEEVVQKTGLTK